MATRFQMRRGTRAQWIAANSVLASGEPGVETDTAIFKIGDGITAWTALVATGDPTTLAATVTNATQAASDASAARTAIPPLQSAVAALQAQPQKQIPTFADLAAAQAAIAAGTIADGSLFVTLV